MSVNSENSIIIYAYIYNKNKNINKQIILIKHFLSLKQREKLFIHLS